MKNSKFKIWAVVPARSGSKSVKNKNIKHLDGLPLIAHTINSAKFSNCFEKILLLTDSTKYAKIGKKFGAEIPFIRPKKFHKINQQIMICTLILLIILLKIKLIYQIISLI